MDRISEIDNFIRLIPHRHRELSEFECELVAHLCFLYDKHHRKEEILDATTNYYDLDSDFYRLRDTVKEI